MPRSNILLMAWGEPFVDKLAEVTIRTLSSQGNLPALAARRDLHFLLYTDRASRDHFIAQTRGLERFGTITLSLFEETVVDGHSIADAAAGFTESALKHEIERHVQFHAIDTTLRDGAGDTLIFLAQDMVVADGSIPALQALIDAGAEAVCVPTLRLSAEASGLTMKHLRSLGEHGISAREICAGMPGNLHPVTRRSLAGSSAFTTYPAAIIWDAAPHGWLCRSFFPTPIAWVPTPGRRRFDSTIDYDFALSMATRPERVQVPQNSDSILVCKLTTERYLESPSRPNLLTRNALAHFLLVETNRAHRTLADQPYRLVKTGGTTAETAWQQVESASRQTLTEAYDLVAHLPALLPDSPQLRAARRSHFGDLDAYLSPMRRGEIDTGAA